jgi:hypothetical protein
MKMSDGLMFIFFNKISYKAEGVMERWSYGVMKELQQSSTPLLLSAITLFQHSTSKEY